MPEGFSHLDSRGEIRMVDVSDKTPLPREAVAVGRIRLQATTLERIESHQIAKGNVFATARLARR